MKGKMREISKIIEEENRHHEISWYNIHLALREAVKAGEMRIVPDDSAPEDVRAIDESHWANALMLERFPV